MTIQEIYPHSDYTLRIVAQDGRIGLFDVTPYLQYDVFAALKNYNVFIQISNGGYFIEWECGADLSADTIEARWHVTHDGHVDAQSHVTQGKSLTMTTSR